METQPLIIKPNRQASATDLPLAGNNFLQASYSFVFTSMATGVPVRSELTLVVNPEEFQQTESSTSTVVLTAGDVFSDSYGPGLTRIRISGSFGQRPSGGSGSGQLEAMRLRQFFRKYLDEVNPITTNGPNGPTRNYGAKLQFFNPKDNEFWDIEVPGDYLTITRSKNAPFLYRYVLTFIGMTPSTDLGIFDTLQSIVKAADNISNINDNISNILNEVSNNAQSIATTATVIGLGAVFFPNQILTPLTNLSTAVSSFVSGSSQIINYPLAGIDQLISNAKNMLVTLDDAYNLHIINQDNGINDGFQYDPNVDNILTTIIQNCAFLELYENEFAKNFIKTDFITQTSVYDLDLINVNLTNVTNVVYAQISYGDTIETLAATYMGDINMWKTLAEFNNLVYPFIYIVNVNNPLDFQPEKTLGLGMNIAIPQFVGGDKNNLILGANETGPDTTNFAFGTDFFLTSTNDIVITSAGDIQTVSGLANLIQAIYIKMNVFQGELIRHLNFGLPNLLGYRTLSFISALASSSIKATLLSDTRITGVSNINISLNQDVLNYSCEVQPNFNSQPVIVEGTIGGNNLPA